MRVQIPNSNVEITRLGYGCGRLAPGLEAKHSYRMIETALAKGIRHFDTAPLYGSEELLGQILSGDTSITVTTKFGIDMPGSKDGLQNLISASYRIYVKPVLTYLPNIKIQMNSLNKKLRNRNRDFQCQTGMRSLTVDMLLAQVDNSLNRLKRDYIDIYLLHEPQNFNFSKEVLHALDGLKDRGVIRSYGCAYGGQIENTPWTGMGNVDQLAYMEAEECSQNLRIYHGVIRSNMGANIKARDKVTSVLDKNTNSAVIFSASMPWQIKDICNAVFR